MRRNTPKDTTVLNKKKIHEYIVQTLKKRLGLNQEEECKITSFILHALNTTTINDVCELFPMIFKDTVYTGPPELKEHTTYQFIIRKFILA